MAEHRRERVAHLIQAELATPAAARGAGSRAAGGDDHRRARHAGPAHGARLLPHPHGRCRAARGARRRCAARRPFFAAQLGRALGLRVTPELRFEYDTTPDTARRVDALLGETRHGDDEDGDEEPS